MTQNIQPTRTVIPFHTPESQIVLEVHPERETVKQSQNQIAEFFNRNKPANSQHLRNIFTSGELEQKIVVPKVEAASRRFNPQQHTPATGPTPNQLPWPKIIHNQIAADPADFKSTPFIQQRIPNKEQAKYNHQKPKRNPMPKSPPTKKPPVEAASRRFNRQCDATATGLTPNQLPRHELIRNQNAANFSIKPINYKYAPFSQHGGLGKVHQLFGDKLNAMIEELIETLAA